MHILLTWEWACFLSLILGSRISGMKFCFWIFSHSKTSGIKTFHLASSGSKYLGSVPEFHSDHFLILKQNILTSHATCQLLSARLTASKCLSHIQYKLYKYFLLQVGYILVRTSSTALPFCRKREFPERGKNWLPNSYQWKQTPAKLKLPNIVVLYRHCKSYIITSVQMISDFCYFF